MDIEESLHIVFGPSSQSLSIVVTPRPRRLVKPPVPVLVPLDADLGPPLGINANGIFVWEMTLPSENRWFLSTMGEARRVTIALPASRVGIGYLMDRADGLTEGE
ncbi:hypothetical protein EVAR_51537_1 [Eumeta japonica]|uniref:Uncharacterized protein n=1 Tax=Eumeta variegata TaxID=151549 RepID=A0A4C1XEV4_EUMVA|nr:hypothetical protein EVAR_51537_1 [Eumeta japonica]